MLSILLLRCCGVEYTEHCGWKEPKAEKLHTQFHSKVIFIQHEDDSVSIVAGSHNWTKNGLDGGNLEASVVIGCSKDDQIAADTYHHIQAC